MGWSTRSAVTPVIAALVAVAAIVAVLATAPGASAASSDHGASFAVRCPFIHRLTDDPIVHPGEEGAAHSHDFFGNTSTKFDSTYDAMIAAPTTCTRDQERAALEAAPQGVPGPARAVNLASSRKNSDFFQKSPI